MARNPSRVAVKRREVGGLQGEASFTLFMPNEFASEGRGVSIGGFPYVLERDGG